MGTMMKSIGLHQQQLHCLCNRKHTSLQPHGGYVLHTAHQPFTSGYKYISQQTTPRCATIDHVTTSLPADETDIQSAVKSPSFVL